MLLFFWESPGLTRRWVMWRWDLVIIANRTFSTVSWIGNLVYKNKSHLVEPIRLSGAKLSVACTLILNHNLVRISWKIPDRVHYSFVLTGSLWNRWPVHTWIPFFQSYSVSTVSVVRIARHSCPNNFQSCRRKVVWVSSYWKAILFENWFYD